MNSLKSIHLRIFGTALALIFLVSLACGGSATPEQVGRVDDQPASEQAAPAQSEEQSAEPVAEEVAEQPVESASEENAESEATEIFEVGDIVSIGDSVLVVLGWEEVASTDFAKPDEGNKFVAIELLLINQSDTSASVSSLLQMTLKDSTGQNYRSDLLASTAASGGSIDGELSPGERIRGKVGFQVPENVQGLQFVFDADVFGTGKAFVNLGANPISMEPPAEVAGETAQQAFEVGDIVNIGDSVLVVLGWEEIAGDDFSKPDEGNRFIAVELLLVNRSDRAASISSLLQLSLKDSTGQNYKPDLMASSATGSGQIDGELSPGERVRSKVGYQVPLDAQNLQFVFDAEVFGVGKVFVNLGPQPIRVEPPAEVIGETEQQTFNIGDVVEIGTLALTVNEVTSPAGNDFSKPDVAGQIK